MSDLLKLHAELTDAAANIIMAKNHDYKGGDGDTFANFKGSISLGIHPVIGALLRMQDKMMRIKTFVEKGELKVKGESIDDALMDLINYTVIIKGLIDEEK